MATRGSSFHGGFSGVALGTHWGWLTQMRQRFDLAIEVLDTDLECVLETPSSGYLGSAFRAAVSDRIATSVRDTALAVLVSGRARSVTAYGLRIRAVPLVTGAGEGDASGVLLLAQMLPEAFALSTAAIVAIDHHLEAACHWLTAAIETTLDTATADVEKEFIDRVERLIELLGELQQIDDEAELVQRVMGAAGLWGSADVRVYRQDATGTFVLDTCVPGADVQRIPPRLPGSLLTGRDDRVFKLASAAEAETFGWDHPPNATLFVPVSIDDSPDWVIAVSCANSASLAATLALVRTVLGVLLESLNHRSRTRLRRQLATVLRLRDAPFGSTARIGLEILGVEISASSVQLRVTDEAGRHSPLCAEWKSDDVTIEGVEPCQQANVSDRSGWAAVDLTVRRHGRSLSADQVRLAQMAAQMYGLWVSGILLNTGGLGGRTGGRGATALAARLEDQLDADGRLKIGGAVVVFLPDTLPASGPLLDEAMQIVQDHVRPSDVIGLVESSGAGVLLPHAPESVASALVARLKDAAIAHGLERARIGVTMFAPFSENPDTLLARAAAAARASDTQAA